MNRLLTFLTGIIMICSMGASSAQATVAGLIINEIQPGSNNNTKQEFIELLNVSDTIIDLSNNTWAVQIASSSATNWDSPLRTIYLNGYIYPRSHYLIGTTYSDATGAQTYPANADAYFSSALSSTGGHIRIVHSNNGMPLSHSNANTISQISWGALGTFTNQPADNFFQSKLITPGTSLQFDNGTASYAHVDSPSPQSDIAQQPDAEPPTETPDQESGEEPLPSDQTSTAILITELLPNPKTPYTDSNDEYIEVYNPSDHTINLKGYSLATPSGSKKYTFTSEVLIEPHSYAVFYSKQTKLTLSNTKGQAQLINPEGEVVSSSAPYTGAPDGQVWALNEGAWSWSVLATPGSANAIQKAIINATQPQQAKTKKINKSEAKIKSVVKKSKPAIKKSTSKTKKVKTPTKVVTQLAAAKTSKQPAKIHTGILVAVLVITVLYGIYEYRHDLAVRFAKLTGNRRNRP